MKELIIQLFAKKSNGRGKIVFSPELKVTRGRDTLYISEIFECSAINSQKRFFAKVEWGCCNDYQTVPLGLLDSLSLQAIYKRLQCKEEVLLSVKNKD